MMGSVKLSTIRAEVRKAFKMPDPELFAWFNRQLEDLGKKPKAKKAEMNALRLLRDALVKEVEHVRPRRKPRRLSGRKSASGPAKARHE